MLCLDFIFLVVVQFEAFSIDQLPLNWRERPRSFLLVGLLFPMLHQTQTPYAGWHCSTWMPAQH
jgi:hypothetical protein